MFRNERIGGKHSDDSVSIYSEFDSSEGRTELVQAQVHKSKEQVDCFDDLYI